MSKPVDWTGQKFHRLTAIRLASVKPTKWLWRCDCGTEKALQVANVVYGKTHSCGCLSREQRGCTYLENGIVKFTHRMSGSPEHEAWSAMKSRCLNARHKSFHNYGGRGIQVCPEWQENFDAFFRDVGSRPSKRHSLDRIDNDGNYEPGNCRWALPIIQRSNSRQNRQVTIGSTTKTMAEWGRISGLSTGTVYSRLALGWTVEDALTKQSRKLFPGPLA